MTRRTPPRTPVAVVILAAVAVALFALPFVALAAETPWGDLWAIMTSEMVVSALGLSALSSFFATILALTLGVPLAFVLARHEFRGKAVVRALVLLPLVLPPVVGGAALLFALGRRGLVGQPLYEATGLVLPFSLWGVVVASTFVAMPFLVLTVEGGLRNLDDGYENAASSLGASRWTVMRRVTLPLIRPALIAGAVLTWARAFGEFGATITFAGNLQGRTQTLPLAVFVALEADRDVAIVISLVMVAVSAAVLIVLRDRWWGSRL